MKYVVKLGAHYLEFHADKPVWRFEQKRASNWEWWTTANEMRHRTGEKDARVVKVVSRKYNGLANRTCPVCRERIGGEPAQSRDGMPWTHLRCMTNPPKPVEPPFDCYVCGKTMHQARGDVRLDLVQDSATSGWRHGTCKPKPVEPVKSLAQIGFEAVWPDIDYARFGTQTEGAYARFAAAVIAAHEARKAGAK